MHKNTEQSYRTFFKTPQSRSIQFTSGYNRGFTLIELLVVVSIISLISTIVFGAISDARVKARNTAKNNLVMEYTKALELYRNDNGTYPRHIGQETLYKCIGFAESGDNCFGDEYSGSNSINNAFSNYMSGDFSQRNSIMFNQYNLDGILYKCTDSTCTEYTLEWALEKNISNCISNAKYIPNFYGHTLCIYPE
jgi:general secretion pathway protein G